MTIQAKSQDNPEQTLKNLGGSQRLLNMMFDVLPQGLCLLDRDLNILRANRWLEERFSRQGALQGAKCHQVFQGLSQPCPQCPAQRTLADGETHSEVLSYAAGQDGPSWMELTSVPLTDAQGEMVGVIEYVKDVTEAKHARQNEQAKSQELAQANQELLRVQEIIRTSRNKIQAVLDGIADPLFSLTPQFKVESINMAAARQAGRHPRELVGLSGEELWEVAPLFPAPILTLSDSFARMRKTRQRQWHLVQRPTPRGGEFFEVTLLPVLDPQGDFSLGVVYIKDVTEFKRMEQTIREYSESLEEKVAERTRELAEEKEHLDRANAELLRLERLRRDLTAMMVHDMKGPLAELMGNLDLLTYSELGEMEKETLDLAYMGADDLLRMIMNLLDIDRLEEHRMPLKPEPLDFTELAHAVVEKFHTIVRLKGMDIKIGDQTGQPYQGDREVLGRVLQNLLTNALSHTPEGGAVHLSAQEGDQGGVLWRLEDNGEGIPEHARELVFRKFTQATDDSGPRTSTGLGLTFCKMAVEAHGGRIWFESQVGKGTAFFIWLPRISGETIG